jgi:hypothetical protein
MEVRQGDKGTRRKSKTHLLNLSKGSVIREVCVSVCMCLSLCTAYCTVYPLASGPLHADINGKTHKHSMRWR